MNNYAVLGLGLMGKAICHDILTFDESSKVFGFELDDKRREDVDIYFTKFNDRFSSFKLNLEIQNVPQNDFLVSLLRENEIKVVFGAIDYKFNEYLTRICISANCSYLDLGGNPEIVKKQFSIIEMAKKAGITVIPDCGLAPGMANVVAAHIMDQFDKLDTCEIRVGGLPQDPKTILNYQQVFSIRGLTNEYLEDAIVIRNGNIIKVKSLTEIESLEFSEPWGKLEAFQTAGGTSNLPLLYKGKIKELSYKTIRYPGHCQFFQFLKNFGLLSSEPIFKEKIIPREVTEHQLQKNLPNNGLDAVLVRIKVSGQKSNRNSNIVYDLIDLFDHNTGFSAMARTTAFPISIIGQMIMKKIISIKGVVAGEKVVPKEIFLKELAKRNIKFNIKSDV